MLYNDQPGSCNTLQKVHYVARLAGSHRLSERRFDVAPARHRSEVA